MINNESGSAATTFGPGVCSRCGMTGLHACPGYPVATGPVIYQQGWQCPVCGAVYAPWVFSCPAFNHPQKMATGANDGA